MTAGGRADAAVRPVKPVVVALAAWGPVMFTCDWVVLGLSHHGYRPRTETISSLSAHDAAGWQVMVAGQLVLAAAMGGLAVIVRRALGRSGTAATVLLVAAAAGTVQASAFRTICNHTDTGWCARLPRSAYPDAQWAHGIGTGVAFGALELSVAATTWAVRSGPAHRGLRVAGTWALVVSVPFLAWFLANAETAWHGLAEKVFLVTLAAWVSTAALVLGRPGTELAGNWAGRERRAA